MKDPKLHLVDHVTLDLRHSWRWLPDEVMDTMSRYVDGDKYALAALHCIHFLSNPPISYYCTRRGKDVTHVEWREACATALDMLCNILQKANTLLELVQFVSDNDVHPTVREEFPDKYMWIDLYILAFLSRATVCVNWRIISVIRRALLMGCILKKVGNNLLDSCILGCASPICLQ